MQKKKMKSSQQHHIIYRQFFFASSHHRTSCCTRGQPTWLTGTRASSHPGARAWAAAWSFAVPFVPGEGGCSWVNQRSTDLGHTVPVLQLLTHIHPGRQPQSSFYPWTRAHPLSSGLAETGAQGETVIGIQFWLARQIAANETRLARHRCCHACSHSGRRRGEGNRKSTAERNV